MMKPAAGLASSRWECPCCPSCSLLNQKSENENEAVCPWPPRLRLLVLLPTIRVNCEPVRILIEPRTTSLEPFALPVVRPAIEQSNLRCRDLPMMEIT